MMTNFLESNYIPCCTQTCLVEVYYAYKISANFILACLYAALMMMVGWMCGVVLSPELRERMGIKSVSDAVKQNRLRWLGHVMQKDNDD